MTESLLQTLSASQEYFNRSTRTLEEADSAYAPKPELFTAAQMIAHVAQTIEWFVDGAFAAEGFSMDFEGMDKQVRACGSIAGARAWLDKAYAHAVEVVKSHTAEEWATPLAPGPIMGGAPRFAVFSALAEHTAHHRGALSVYARLLGKVPPMPYGDM